MSGRAALRVMATIGLLGAEVKERLALAALRATLSSAGRGVGRPADVEDLRRTAAHSAHSAARSAAYFADSAARSADSAAHSAAHSAGSATHSADSAARSADSAARSATHSADSAAYFADSAARFTAHSAAAADADLSEKQLLERPVWSGVDIPSALISAHDIWLTFLSSDADWAFWHRWYSQMWEGTFRDWDLAIEVAKLPDELWEGEGALAKVAEAIREIEARQAENMSDIEPEHVPVDNVLPLFDRARFVQASMTAMSEAVSLRLEAFSSMARPNERIQFVESLSNMPETAQRIYDILEKGPSVPNADTALALEVGRLRAENEQLKRDLKSALANIEELRKKPWYGKSGALFAGGILSAIGLALMTVSDDEFSLEQRWKDSVEELEFLVSQFQGDDQVIVPDEFRLRFPDLEDE